MREPVTGTVTPSDLYGFAERLTEAERSVLSELVTVLAEQVKPHLNEHWDAATFPDEIRQPLRDLKLMDPPALKAAGEPVRDILTGFRNFELARTDLNVCTYFNAQAGLFRTAVRLGGSAEQ
ncbi:acyl-CoA dehydrogenase family protein, partial [Citricoccus sp.]